MVLLQLPTCGSEAVSLSVPLPPTAVGPWARREAFVDMRSRQEGAGKFRVLPVARFPQPLPNDFACFKANYLRTVMGLHSGAPVPYGSEPPGYSRDGIWEAEEMTDGLGDIQQIMQTCSAMGLGP